LWINSASEHHIYQMILDLRKFNRELSSTVYDPFPQGTSSNADPRSMSDGSLSAWSQGYNSTGHHSTACHRLYSPKSRFFILFYFYFLQFIKTIVGNGLAKGPLFLGRVAKGLRNSPQAGFFKGLSY